MGVYLSSPITEKISADRQFGKYSYGVSSMQGWRMTQEDSHNCIPDFDPETDTSYFAVYDGHGGAEVAQYSSAKLPDFLKSTLAYKDGQLVEALQEAFLGFDATLRDEQVIKELKSLAGVDDDGEEDEEDCDPVGRTEADILRAEADIPIEELMAKYGDGMIGVPARKFKKDKEEKYLSPVIRAKQSQPIDASKLFKSDNEESMNNDGSGDSDPLAIRLEDKLANGHADNENNLNTEKEIREAELDVSDKAEAVNLDENFKQKPVKDGTDTCIQKSSTLSKNEDNRNSSTSENNSCGSIDSKEADGISVNEEKHIDSSAVTEGGEVSEKVDEAKPYSSSNEPTGSGCQPESSGSGEPSGSTELARVEATSGPSGSGDGPSGSGEAASAGSSGEGPSGSGSGSAKKTSGQTVLDEEFDSEEDSSEDNEYMEESEEEEEEDDDDDDDDEELDEEEKERIGGIFSKVISGDDEEGHIEEPGSDSGCTAVVAVLRKNQLVVANAGDSRCVLCRNGKAVDLSVDHKPEDDDERNRIEAAGGKVTADGRVNGGLNLSRAIGDHWYKRNDSLLPKDQMISAWPDVLSDTIGEDDEFMVIACDGIWNHMTSQEVVDFVKEKLQKEEKRKQLSLICEEMFDYCLAPNTMGDGTGCDNMTCIIVLFNYKEESNKSSKTDGSEVDSSTSEEQQPNKQQPEHGSSDRERTSGEMESEPTETSGTEKRVRENCSEDSSAVAEAHPEKRARLDEDTTVT